MSPSTRRLSGLLPERAMQTAVPKFAVVIPLRNEAANVGPLFEEIRAALATGDAYEVVCVDDGSDDATAQLLAALASQHPWLRGFRSPRGRGQSAALATGVARARAPWIVTMDGDRQNDPRDVPRLVAALATELDRTPGVPVLVSGRRVRRRDSWTKRVASRVANAVRGAILGDRTTDTGCGLKAFRREDFARIPHFDHLHRFLPALFLRAGGRVVAVDVSHRERSAGRSNYGVLDRLWVGIVDLIGVWWLMRRRCDTSAEPIDAAPPS
ncbi:MAG: glycosyltransferase family 2 protein [bacterium]